LSFSGGTHGFVVGHITPEAFKGGVLAVVEDGDEILIDAENNSFKSAKLVILLIIPTYAKVSSNKLNLNINQ
jgi:dihydroxyacid dehydratase/phosphogluconate dehydratase